MFAPQAIAIKYIGLFESPMPRKTELMTLYAVIHGIPTKQIVRYATVPSTASAGVDITATIGRTMQRKNAIIATETMQNKITVLPMVCFSLPLPVQW